jgi:hypothetical protein
MNDWFLTAEGKAWLAATSSLPWPTYGEWGQYVGPYLQARNAIEDFAISCKAVQLGLDIDPIREKAVREALR